MPLRALALVYFWVEEKDKMLSFAEYLIGIPNEFNKFNNTEAWMQDSVYHMILKSHLINKFCTKTSQFRIRKRDVFMDLNA